MDLCWRLSPWVGLGFQKCLRQSVRPAALRRRLLHRRCRGPDTAWLPSCKLSWIFSSSCLLRVFNARPCGVADRVALFACTGKHLVCQYLICLIAKGFRFFCGKKVTLWSGKVSCCHDSCHWEPAEADRAALRNNGAGLQNGALPMRQISMPGRMKNEGGRRIVFLLPAFHPCPCGAAINISSYSRIENFD